MTNEEESLRRASNLLSSFVIRISSFKPLCLRGENHRNYQQGISMSEHSEKRCWYRVQVGLTTVLVEATNVEEAIVAARRKLTAELPRMYDVIRGLEATRFEVKPAA
jgi:hypothetical protein